jgi:hypothetical protein
MSVRDQLALAKKAYLEELTEWKSESLRLRKALKRFRQMVENDKLLVREEHREELIETLRQANEALG